MLLRDHPLLSHQLVPSWPPAWNWTGGPNDASPVGEVGIFRDVTPSNVEPADRCFLHIDIGTASYMGCLAIDNVTFCQQVVELLRNHRNRPIAEIGSLNISHLLQS